MNVNFDSEVEFKPFRVDIYFPEWHFALEVDGPIHSRKKDEVRDNTLMIAYQLPVVHVRSGAKKQLTIDIVTHAAEIWADTAEDRKRHAR